MQLESSDRQAIIVRQLKEGSKEAFRLLFETYGPKIHAFGTFRMKAHQVLFPIPFDELNRYQDDKVLWQNPGY